MKLKGLKTLFILLTLFCFSCTSYKNIPYFQDLNTNGVTKEDINNYSPLIIQPGDIIGLFVTSANPEASSVFNFNLNRQNGENADRSPQNAVIGYLVDSKGLVRIPLLGEIKVAQAINETNGELIYEVVYSEVVDNLLNLGEYYPDQANIYGASVPQSIYWQNFIPLDLGPWYTSETNIFTSYINSPSGQEFYTSLTPGAVRTLYPNSLVNMRNRVGQVLGQVYNSKLLPLWMTSQQVNGSTLGYTPAWVICYTQPGTVTGLTMPITLPDGTTTLTPTYAQYIQYQINNNWLNPVGQKQSLNTINFTIDRFTVNKSITYNYDNNSSPPAWTALPSATPVPNPLDSQDFYVLFPQKTILPDKSQY